MDGDREMDRDKSKIEMNNNLKMENTIMNNITDSYYT